MAYTVVRLTGDYTAREAEARRRGCAMVWHQHLNSVADPRPSYTLVEVAYPTTARELKCARDAAVNYARRLGGGYGDGDGVKILKDGARGESIVDGNVEAFISEPLFASNPTQAKWVAQSANQRALAKDAVDAIKANYPDGSVIGLSIGHIGKTSNPSDRGAIVVGTGLTEAAVCTEIIAEMERLLKEAPKVNHIYGVIVDMHNTAHRAALKAIAARQNDRLIEGNVAVSYHTDEGVEADQYIAYAKQHGLENHTVTNGAAAHMVIRSTGPEQIDQRPDQAAQIAHLEAVLTAVTEHLRLALAEAVK